jgi:glycerol-3-phosphate acyltransferase PlsY
MESIVYLILGITGSYLLGSIPTAVWVGKWFFSLDIREHGSGNAGATNTVRVLGPRAGIPVLIFDITKGWFPVFIASKIPWSYSPETVEYLQILFGLAAVLGHVYPVFAGFRGGKGVGTLAGMSIGLFPLAFLSSLLTFIVVIYLTRYVSLGSIAAGIAFPVFLVFVFKNNSMPLVLLGFFASSFIIYTHRSNIRKLLKGTENKFTLKTKKEYS